MWGFSCSNQNVNEEKNAEDNCDGLINGDNDVYNVVVDNDDWMSLNLYTFHLKLLICSD